MFTLAKFANDFIRSAFPNRGLLKTANVETKRNVLHRMTSVLISHDRFLNDEYYEVNGCYKLKRTRHERAQQRTRP